MKNFFFGNDSLSELKIFLRQYKQNQAFILIDKVVYKNHKEKLTDLFNVFSKHNILQFSITDENKSLSTVQKIWKKLVEKEATRDSLIINIGGGSLCDLGGFVASTYHRGILFINIPTTLLSMVDASLGGKNGINFLGYKNQIGTFNEPKAVCIDISFLETLPSNQLLSGYAEMIKHSLLDSNKYFNVFSKLIFPKQVISNEHILKSIEIKSKIVKIDPKEKNIRKSLNFGHTIGHALETYFLNSNKSLLHGECVAIGLLCETYMSFKMLNFPEKELFKLQNIVKNNFTFHELEKKSQQEILLNMKHDKKNSNNNHINFTLLSNLGEICINQYPDEKLIYESMDFYNHTFKANY